MAWSAAGMGLAQWRGPFLANAIFDGACLIVHALTTGWVHDVISACVPTAGHIKKLRTQTVIVFGNTWSAPAGVNATGRQGFVTATSLIEGKLANLQHAPRTVLVVGDVCDEKPVYRQMSRFTIVMFANAIIPGQGPTAQNVHAPPETIQ
jgi:hypothetical protein